MSSTLPTFFIPHGAGPCFFMDWEPPGTWDAMAAWLRALPVQVGARPAALVVVSAHWEAPVFTVTTNPRPDLIYDYHGFPEETYRLRWAAPGDPALALRIRALLATAGIEAAEDPARGLDHGVFIPLKLAFPQADIPVVQVSLRRDLDPAAHLALGRALAPLRSQGVLLIGSGMSYHNMAGFRFAGGPASPESERFDAWLFETATRPGPERAQPLGDWTAAPAARAAHPREEHLLPLHVVAGAGGDEPGERVFHGTALASRLSAFRFGPPATPSG